MDETPLFEHIDSEGNDIRDRIISSKIKGLNDFISTEISKKTIALIWAVGNEIEDYTKMKSFWNFQTDSNLERAKDEFVESYNEMVKKQKIISKENKKLQREFLPALKKYDIDEFKIAENTIGGSFKAPVNFTPTSDVPISKEDSRIKAWVDYRDVGVVELFAEIEVDSNKIIFIDIDSNEGVLDNKFGVIEFASPPDQIERNAKRIEKAIGTKIKKLKKEKIKGEFVIKDKNIDRRIFAMLVLRKDFYKNRIFIDESGKVLHAKDRFTLKYYPNTLEFSNPIFITLTNSGNNLVVKMAKIPNEASIAKTKTIVLGILSDYDSSRAAIIKRYKRDDPNLTFTTKDIVKKKPSTQATKTKQKLGPLIEKNPELFNFKGYARLCPASDQPMIPTDKKVKNMKRGNPARIIEFPKGSGDYYTCDHITKIKKGESKVRVYPGLRPDTESVKTGRESRFKYVPCCYPIDQYKKPSSGLNKYIQAGTASKIIPKKSVGILDKQKKLGHERRGFIPSTLAEIMEFHGMKPDQYLRYGLPPSKQSIIDAAAMIKYPKEWMKDYESARDMVLSDLDSDVLNAGIQSYTLDYMKDALGDDTLELKAANMMPVLEYYLNAVVIIVDVDELAEPDAKFGFIPQLFQRKRLVIIYKHKDSEQIEVVGTYQRNFDSYASKKVITNFLRTKRSVYGFYSSTNYTYPKHARFISRAEGQYVDAFGKCRGFLVRDQSIFMAPIAPINKPVLEDIYIKNPLKRMKEFGLKPLYEDKVSLYSKKFVLAKEKDYGYSAPPDDYVRPYIIPQNSFFVPSYEAETDAIDLMNGEDIEVDQETENILEEWEALEVQAPKRPVSLEQISNVIVLNNKFEALEYVGLLKTMGVFKWERLEELKHTAGTVHNVLLPDADTLIVLDIKRKPKKAVTEEGLYDVSYGRKIEEGPGVVRYYHDNYGLIL